MRAVPVVFESLRGAAWAAAQATEARVARQSLIRRIAELQVGGQVAVWESGRDCDSVRYRGFKCLIPATVRSSMRSMSTNTSGLMARSVSGWSLRCWSGNAAPATLPLRLLRMGILTLFTTDSTAPALRGLWNTQPVRDWHSLGV
jgi:hypothetical protein